MNSEGQGGNVSPPDAMSEKSRVATWSLLASFTLAVAKFVAALFSGSLANHCAMSDLKMNRLLAALDEWAERQHLFEPSPVERFEPTVRPAAPRLSCDLSRGKYRTVIWATGFRPDYGWLRLPVFDAKGRLAHDGGVVAPGLYVLGLPFMRRRNSALIDGVGDDAEALADHLVRKRGRMAA